MIKKRIEDEKLLEHLKNIEMDHKEIYLLADESIRLSIVNATEMVNQVKANFSLGLLESYILSQGYIAGSLLSSTVKGNDRVLLQLECGGPVKGMSIESWASGAVRGYLATKSIALEKPLESLDTSFLYGPGFLSVTKILEGSKTPFTGQVMMEYGNLAKDLAMYFTQSEQTPSLFYIDLSYDERGNIDGAGGIFIQALPSADEKTLEEINSMSFAPLAKAIRDREKLGTYIEREFSRFSARLIKKSLVGFSCPCSKEGFLPYIKSMMEKNEEEFLSSTFPLTVECINCASTYSYTKDEVLSLRGSK